MDEPGRNARQSSAEPPLSPRERQIALVAATLVGLIIVGTVSGIVVAATRNGISYTTRGMIQVFAARG
jgi:hypothetical protein